MPILFLVMLLLLGGTAEPHSALSLLAPMSQRGMSSNSMSALVWDGENLWAASGSGISRSLGLPSTALDWIFFTTEDGLPSDIIPGLAVSSGRVYASTATYLDETTSYTLDYGTGIVVSGDAGESWNPLPLDRAEGLANICWQLAANGDTLWAACWNGLAAHTFPSGLAVSQDGGATWEFPDVSEFLGPSAFAVAVRGTQCWVGTGHGVGKTIDLGHTWAASTYESGNLGGDWIVALGLPPGDTLSAWAATRRIPASDGSAAYGSDGVSFTRDGGLTWVNPELLEGVSAWDFAFSGDTVWIATEEGLGFSADNGTTWTLMDIDSGLPREIFYSVAVVGNHVYAGSSDGLVWSLDGGATWEVMLASQPQGTLDTPTTYCYPNPFSPGRDQEARIRYSLGNACKVFLSIFDFAENEIRTVVDGESRGIGTLLYEAWDGRDDHGRIVPNGTYFYKLWTDRSSLPTFGKIMVLD